MIKGNPPAVLLNLAVQTALRGFAHPPLMFAANQFPQFFASQLSPKGGQKELEVAKFSCPPLNNQSKKTNPVTQCVTRIRGGHSEVVQARGDNKHHNLTGGVNVLALDPRPLTLDITGGCP